MVDLVAMSSENMSKESNACKIRCIKLNKEFFLLVLLLQHYDVKIFIQKPNIFITLNMNIMCARSFGNEKKKNFIFLSK